MELAVIMLENTADNQELSRQIRDFHKKRGSPSPFVSAKN